MVNTIPLSEMSEEDEPAESPFMADLVSYDRLMELVEGLPDGYSKVFKLAVLEGLPHKEIGDLLHIAASFIIFAIVSCESVAEKDDCRLSPGYYNIAAASCPAVLQLSALEKETTKPSA